MGCGKSGVFNLLRLRRRRREGAILLPACVGFGVAKIESSIML